MGKMKSLIKGIGQHLFSDERVRLRAEWYRSEITQALENKDYERATWLEDERIKCYGSFSLF